MPSPETAGRDPTARRLVVFVSFLVLCMAALIFRYTMFMIVDGHPSGDPVVRLPEVERGPILDRNGRLLAVTIARDSVTAWAPAVAEPHAAAALLAGILDLPEEELLRLFGSDGFVYLKRHVTPGEAAAVRAARDRGEKLRGIDLQAEQARSYPEGELAAHVLGFAGVDNVGLEGIENSFNHVLAPDTIVPEGGEVFGNQVFLTLDVNVQHGMEQLAADAPCRARRRCRVHRGVRRRHRRDPGIRSAAIVRSQRLRGGYHGSAGATPWPPCHTSRARYSRSSRWPACCRPAPSRPQ